MVAHNFLAALNFAISSKKPLCALKKKDTRLQNLFGSRPFFMPALTYAIAFEKVKANSCSAVLPASLI